ncbi:MAG TPA: hypothetical protein VEU96_30160 [Bryobacteraceae bacterium]|nr:hypothetical protein [Bryobacteraceae bacterium]
MDVVVRRDYSAVRLASGNASRLPDSERIVGHPELGTKYNVKALQAVNRGVRDRQNMMTGTEFESRLEF